MSEQTQTIEEVKDEAVDQVETTAEISELSGILLDNIKGFRILDNPVPPPKNTKEFIFFKII